MLLVIIKLDRNKWTNIQMDHLQILQNPSVYSRILLLPPPPLPQATTSTTQATATGSCRLPRFQPFHPICHHYKHRRRFYGGIGGGDSLSRVVSSGISGGGNSRILRYLRNPAAVGPESCFSSY